jgi:hypothetical protein
MTSLAYKTLEECAADGSLTVETLLSHPDSEFLEWSNYMEYDIFQRTAIFYERKVLLRNGSKIPVSDLQTFVDETGLAAEEIRALTTEDFKKLVQIPKLHLIEMTKLTEKFRAFQGQNVGSATENKNNLEMTETTGGTGLDKPANEYAKHYTTGCDSRAHLVSSSISSRGSAGSPVSKPPIKRTSAPKKHKREVKLVAILHPATKKEIKVKIEGGHKPAVVKSRSTPSTKKHAGGVREKICTALAELHALGIKEAPRIHVALFSDYQNVKSAGFAKALSGVKTAGLIEYPSKGTVRLTASGIAATPPVQPPASNAETLLRLQQVLKKTSGKGVTKSDQICQLLSDGQPHTQEAVADATGYTNVKSSGFAKVLSKLSSLGLIVRLKGTNTVQLADVAFPYGRPEPGTVPGPSVP